MSNTYYISTYERYYGAANDEEAENTAEVIAEMASKEFTQVNFVVISGEKSHNFEDEDLLGDVQQYINDNWTDWI